MILDTDKLSRPGKGLLEWDFSVKVDGKTYRVDPLTVEQMGMIHEALSSGDGRQLRDVGVALFVAAEDGDAAAPAPVQDWRTEKLVAAIAGLVEYFHAVTRKNFEGLSTWVKGEMANVGTPAARTTTSGSSSSSPRS